MLIRALLKISCLLSITSLVSLFNIKGKKAGFLELQTLKILFLNIDVHLIKD